MARRSVATMVLGAVVWTALAAASAGAVALLSAPSPRVVELSADIVRTPVPRGPQWRLKPVPAAASRLFFSAGKGPRADVYAGPPSELETPNAQTIELASISEDSASAALSPGPARLAALTSLADPVKRAEEKACLSEVVYFEGRGQPIEAQIAVGQTVINRALSGAYPHTLCGVAHQHGAHAGECQYSFACDGLSSITKDRSDWDLAQQLSERLLSGAVWLPGIGDATHLHPLAEHPAWVKYLQRVTRIGALVFYRGEFTAAAGIKAPVAD